MEDLDHEGSDSDRNARNGSWREPIAVIGMGCRWPGGCSQPSELWDFLISGKDAYSEFPPDRININGFYHEKKGRPGSVYTRGGCFINSDVREFDPTFFGINPQEALTMDPAQRKLLEVVYETFESAGKTLDNLNGSLTGCFVGNFNYDHQLMQYRDAEYPESYSVTGGGITILSNRINYVFNLKGPSVTIDTACSSSMYALHLACLAIHNGDCTGAIVAGSNLLLTPECQLFSSVLGAVSPTSRCHSFDASADGYARADGIGALYIRGLADALKDGDPIRAVIRGTAANSNGRTAGISHPSATGQAAAIRNAYYRAGNLDLAETGYIECHGTGTAVGDPLEVAAVTEVFADVRSTSNPLFLGSIKSNIGHSEAASGIAGIMKTILALEHDVIPPTVGFEMLNPNIDLKDGSFQVVSRTTSWPNLPVRRAGVNSFGYGGANAHAILESTTSFFQDHLATRSLLISVPAVCAGIYLALDGENSDHHANGELSDARALKLNEDVSSAECLLVFSAHNERTLKSNIKAYANAVHNLRTTDLAHILGVRRSALSYRSFVVANRQRPSHELLRQDFLLTRKLPHTPRIGFVFTGQGAQWSQMGLDLLNSYPVFLNTIRYLDQVIYAFHEEPACSLEGAIWTATLEDISKPELSQPSTTALQIALIELLRSWNIRSVASIGHSSGEIAAAYSAGLITMEEAIIIAYYRGKSISEGTREGLMLAVGVSEKAFKSIVENPLENVTIACHNSPDSITLSGTSAAILGAKSLLDQKNKFTKLLSTGNKAYHSSHMLTVGTAYEEYVTRRLKFSSAKSPKLPKTPFFSTVTGKAEGKKPLGAQYWRSNLELPVLFHEAMERLIQTESVDILLEIGPHAALKTPVHQIVHSLSRKSFPDYLATLIRGQNSCQNVQATAGNLWVRGYPVDINAINSSRRYGIVGDDGSELRRLAVELPHYQWQYEASPLLENRWTKEWRLRRHARHDILGSRIPGASPTTPVWRNLLRPKDIMWLQDHRLGSQIVFPASGYVAMAIEAASQDHEYQDHDFHLIKHFVLEGLTLEAALVIPSDDSGVETLLTLYPAKPNNGRDTNSSYAFLVASISRTIGQERCLEHARGQITVSFEDSFPSRCLSDPCQVPKLKRAVLSSHWYEAFGRVAFNYGRTFQGLSNIRCTTSSHVNVADAEIRLDSENETSPSGSRYIIHPAALDAALQLCIVASQSGVASRLKNTLLPVFVARLTMTSVNQGGEFVSARGFSASRFCGIRDLVSDLFLRSPNGVPLLEITGLRFVSSDQKVSAVVTGKIDPYLRLIWKPEFDFLSTTDINRLHPPISLNESAITPALDELAFAQLTQFYVLHQDFFKTPPAEIHTQRFLSWIAEKVEPASHNLDAQQQEVLNYSVAKRHEHIRILSSLADRSSEARLMCRIYENLPAIIMGEKSGLQIALQDGLLVEMYESGQSIHEGNRRLAIVIDLLAHKSASLRVLEVGAGTGSATRQILSILKGDTLFRRYKSYVFTDVTPSFLKPAEERLRTYKGVSYSTFDMEKPASDQGYEPDFDLVVASNALHASSNILQTLRNVRSVMRTGGKLILLEVTQTRLFSGLILGTFVDFWNGHRDESFPRLNGPFLSKEIWLKALTASGFSGIDFFLDDFAEDPSSTVLVATAIGSSETHLSSIPSKSEGISIAFRKPMPGFTLDVQRHLGSHNISVDLHQLDDEAEPQYNQMIFLVDFSSPLLDDITLAEWQGLQTLIRKVRSGLWITHGGLLCGRNPNYASTQGLLRGIKTEKRDLRLALLDLDRVSECSTQDGIETIFKVLKKITNSKDPACDLEFQQMNGLLFRSSLYADAEQNEEYSSRLEQSGRPELLSLSQLQDIPLQLNIEKPSVLSTLSFKEDKTFGFPLERDYVEIDVKAVGLNNKDLAVLTGSHHSNTFSSECAGRVRQTGNDVKGLKAGDNVVCLAFAKFGTRARVPASFCQKMEDEDSFEEMATIPLVFCTAIYGLIRLGHLSKGETVLIQSATGGLGYAAIQIARYCGAEIFATVGSEAKKKELLENNLDILADHVYLSRDKDSPQLIRENTKGRGIDVILSSSRGDLVYDYWRCIASFGRFIEVGRMEVLGNGHLQMNGFLRNASFTSFDIELISKERPQIIIDLMATIGGLHHQKKIRPIRHERFHIAHIETALMRFTEESRTGKIVVVYEDAEIPVKYSKSSFQAKFDPSASYLLVGCLGGLGQSVSEWMVEQGARKLIFLSRSGGEIEEVGDFLSSLSLKGVETTVIKGDVSRISDVKRAVVGAQGPIKGVIQAALTLNDTVFEKMTLDNFRATVDPRVCGTINLHNALQESPLDFFLMLSSWTAIFGTATQANYLASCTFMDAFARHRHSLGLPATSLSLNAIHGPGSLGRRPEYAIAMARNGLYGNSEEDFLHYCDTAIATSGLPPEHSYDPLSHAHMLAGIDPRGLYRLDQTYRIHEMSWYHDQRLSGLVQAVGIVGSQDTAWTPHLEDETQGDVQERIHKKIAQLLYTSADNVSVALPINDYGIDSMIAAELRNWLFISFGTDIPLLDMLSPTVTIEELGRQVLAVENIPPGRVTTGSEI